MMNFPCWLLDQTKKSVIQNQVNQTICEEVKWMCLASVAPCIEFHWPPGDQMKGYALTASVPRSLNSMKPWRLPQDSAVYFAIFIFHEFSLAWLCKTLVPINDLPQQRRCRKLIWAHLQTLWRPWSLIRFQRGFWGGRHLGTEKGKTR